MKLSQLDILTALIESNCNITETSKKINLAQSAISRQIQLLEEELGFPLVVRRGKRLLGTTELYEKISPQILAMRQSRSNILNLAQEHRDVNKGILRIGTTHTQARFFLPPAVAEFREKYPNVQFSFEQSDPEHILAMLHKNEIDLAVCTDLLESSEKIAVVDCYRWNHILLLPKDHPLTNTSRKLKIKDLAEHPLVTYVSYMTGGNVIKKAFEAADFKANIVFSVTDSEIIKTYVDLGLGLGIIAIMACLTKDKQDLRLLPIDHLFPQSIARVAHLKANYLPSFAFKFIDLLASHGKKLEQTIKKVEKSHAKL